MPPGNHPAAQPTQCLAMQPIILVSVFQYVSHESFLLSLVQKLSGVLLLYHHDMLVA